MTPSSQPIRVRPSCAALAFRDEELVGIELRPDDDLSMVRDWLNRGLTVVTLPRDEALARWRTEVCDA